MIFIFDQGFDLQDIKFPFFVFPIDCKFHFDGSSHRLGENIQQYIQGRSQRNIVVLQYVRKVDNPGATYTEIETYAVVHKIVDRSTML